MRPITLRRTSKVLAVMATLLLASACGRNGDDEEARQAAETEAAPSLPEGPDFDEFAETVVPDAEARPQMQLQVVLDRQGFGPGVIDGNMRLPTRNALKGFQEATGLSPTGELDEATRSALARWADIPATRVVRIPESWARIEFVDVPEEIQDQADLNHLSYESLGEKLAERFHTTVEVLRELNPGGQPAGTPPADADTSSPTNAASAVPAYPPRTRVTPTPQPGSTTTAAAWDGEFRPGQLVRVPNVAAEPVRPGSGNDEWLRTLASLSVGSEQPAAARVVVDKSESWLKAYDEAGKLIAMYTVTSGSGHDPLPLGEWGITGVSYNPPFNFDPDLFWDVPDHEAEQQIPPGPNGPVGVVWIDLTKEHYGIHGTPEPQNIGVTQSHGCVRLTNWDAARLAGMVNSSTEVIFQA